MAFFLGGGGDNGSKVIVRKDVIVIILTILVCSTTTTIILCQICTGQLKFWTRNIKTFVEDTSQCQCQGNHAWCLHVKSTVDRVLLRHYIPFSPKAGGNKLLNGFVISLSYMYVNVMWTSNKTIMMTFYKMFNCNIFKIGQFWHVEL